MPIQNPFLRRASSPGEFINYKKRKSFAKLPALPQQTSEIDNEKQIISHPAKLTQASLSDPALKVPPTVVVTEYQPLPDPTEGIQYRPFPALKSRRPSRFLKLPTATHMTTIAQLSSFPPTPSTSSSSPTPTIIYSTNNSVTSSSSSSMKTQQDNSSTSSMEDHQAMAAFHRLYETFTQKLYMEGYMMKHHPENKSRTKMFVELCGSVMTLWEAESNTGTSTTASVMPTRFFHLADHTDITSQTVTDEKQCHYIFTVKNKTTSMTFETSDKKSLKRWMLAIRLSCFEKQKLHQLFTSRQLTGLADSDTMVEEGAWLQVKLSHEAHWQKYWVVLDHTGDNSNKKKKKHMFGQLSYKKQQQHVATDEHHYIYIYESKKSKQPLFTLTKVLKGYAIYPESMQLIEKNSMLRFDCQLTTTATSETEHELSTCWFMADSSQLAFQWLLKVYDTFHLYGRPGNLVEDCTHPDALNYGELLTTVDQSRLFLETEEVFQYLSTKSVKDQEESESLFNNIIFLKQQQVTKTVGLTRRITNRANSLPLITISDTAVQDDQAKDTSKSLDLSTAAMLSSSAYKPTRQVADSSDESDDENDEEQSEDDEEGADQQDSEDEDEGLSPTAAATSFASSLIPDFNLGNGFDVSEDVSTAAVTSALSNTVTDKKKKAKQKTTRHHSSIAMFGSLEIDDKEPTPYQFKGSFPLHSRKGSMPNPPKPKATTSTASRRSLNSTSGLVTHTSPSPTTTPSSPELASKTTTDLFGDFDLISDFGNFLKEPSFSTPRKYSLPASTKLNSSASSVAHGGINWEEYDIEEQRRPSSHHSRRQQRSPRPHRHQQHNRYQHSRSRHPYDEDEADDDRDLEGRGNYDDDEEEEDVEESRSTLQQRDPHSVYYRHRRSEEPYDSDEDGCGDDSDEDDEGPLIPSLGDHFAPQNSLLDTYLGEQLSAKEQIEYAKATGQPLIKVSTTKKEDKTTRGGLVGMISQREKDRKEGNGLRLAERVNQHHLDKMEKEKERRLFEQRQQQIYQHQMMLFANGYGLPAPPVMPMMNAMSPIMNGSAANGTVSPLPMSPMAPLSPINLAMMHQHQQQQQQQQPPPLTSPSPNTHRSMTPPATTFLSPQLSQYNPYFPPMSNGYFTPQPYSVSPAPGSSSTSTSPAPTPLGMPYSQPASAMGFYYYPQQQLLQPHQQSTGRYSPHHLTAPADTRRRSSSAKSVTDDLLMTARTTTSTSTSSDKSNTRRSVISPHGQRSGRRSISPSSGVNTVTTTNSSISSATSSSSSFRPSISSSSISSSGSSRLRT